MSLNQSSTVANNYQSFEFIPLVTITTKSSGKYYFQLSDRDQLMVDNIAFNFLSATLQNVSGSAIPYSPYRYRFSITNSNSGMSPRTTEQSNQMDSLLKLIDNEDGLRGALMTVYYYYPESARMDRQGTFIISSTTIATDNIVLDLINEIS